MGVIWNKSSLGLIFIRSRMGVIWDWSRKDVSGTGVGWV